MNLILACSIVCIVPTFAKTKIACVGDSITFGAGVAARPKLNYPAQLGYLLGENYEVKNFGVSARTMLNKGDHPYTKDKAYRNSLTFEPDIVIIKLGTNDSKPHNWKFKAEFSNDTKALILSYQQLASKPRIILCKPVVVARDRWGITEKVTRGQVSKAVEQTAYETGVELIDLHTTLVSKQQYIPDGVHPNAFGAEILARHIHRYLVTERLESTLTLPKNAKKSSFQGYDCYSFNHQGAAMKIVTPKKAAKGKPWVWRARFWGHQPQFDTTMLELGWHIVFCDVANLFGSPKAMERWQNAYQLTQILGLGQKPVLEGMSRGGLPIHNWALKHPDKTGGIIGDNCVMDATSWPGGFGSGKGSSADWKRHKIAYGFKSDEDAKAYNQYPVNTVEKIAQQNTPILYLIGDADPIVPHKENSGLAASILKGYKHLEVIMKPGLGHHPHALPDPARIVDFALRCNGSYQSPSTLPAPSASFQGQAAGWGGGIWWDQHTNINALAQANKDLELIFLGDSISQSLTGSEQRLAVKGGKRAIDQHFASEWKTASFGISGDRTEHLLYRIQNGNFNGLKPKVVVVMIGVNNALRPQHNAKQITAGIKAVTEALHAKLPATQILLLGPLPAGKSNKDAVRQTLATVQQSIAPLDGKNNVHYLNLWDTFLDQQGSPKPGLLSGDFIHLNPAGYEAWAKALKPHIEKLAK